MVADLEKHLVARGLKLIEPAVGAGFAVDEVVFGAKGEPEVWSPAGPSTPPSRRQAAAPAEPVRRGGGVTHDRHRSPHARAGPQPHRPARRLGHGGLRPPRRRPRRTCASAAVALAGRVERQPGRHSAGPRRRPRGGARSPAARGSRSSPGPPPTCSRNSRRAADRLADPKCKQIRDAAGVYFFDRPLVAAGHASPCSSPARGRSTRTCSPTCAASSPRSRRRSPGATGSRPRPAARRRRSAGCSTSRRTRPTREGRGRGRTAQARAVHLRRPRRRPGDLPRPPRTSQLPVAAVAGHSAGELAALLAAGAMRSEDRARARGWPRSWT